jgi:uncharacterized protein YbjT (DUF2867 family)
MILITGASGNVGREVLKQIAETGTSVRAAFQSMSKAASAPKGVEVAVVDYEQPETMRAALKGVDKVFLVGPPTTQLVALERSAINTIRQTEVRHVVKLSAMGGRAATFPRQHAESEDYIRSSGVAYTFLRPNGFMQNILLYSGDSIRTQNAFYGSEGEGRVSQIDIRDIAAVAVKTLTESGHEMKTYTLTGPAALPNSEVAKILSEALGRGIRFVNLEPPQLKSALLAAGAGEWSANALVDLQRLYREGGAATVTADVKQILGRSPRSFAEFAKENREALGPRELVAS